LSFSLPLLCVGLLGVILGWIDSVFVWAKLPLSDLRIYQAATIIYGFLLIPPQALSISLYPQISELYGRHGGDSLSEAFKVASRYTSFTYIPLVFASIIFSKQVVSILTGPQYSEATIPFSIMAFGAFAAGFTMILNLNFMTLGKTKHFLSLQALSFAIYLSILTPLVPMLGVEGAAVSKAVTASFTMLVTFLALKKHMRVCLDSEGCLKSTASSLIASALVMPLTTLHFPLISFPLQLSLFVTVYLFALIALKSVHDYDLARLEAFLPARIRFLADLLHKFVR